MKHRVKTRKNMKKYGSGPSEERGRTKTRSTNTSPHKRLSVSLPPIATRYTNTSTKNKNTTRKRVKINTPENELYEFTLGTSELEWKREKPFKDVKKCKANPYLKADFPCKRKRTIFNSKKEYDDYEDLKYEKNKQTGYKRKSEHYDDIETLLMLRGSDLIRI